MDTELKAKWIEALRSGKYQQGKNFLCQDQLHCCLGVLCEVAGAEKRDCESGVVEFTVDGSIRVTHLREGDFGLKNEQIGGLIKMNDKDLHNFKEIATHIEAFL